MKPRIDNPSPMPVTVEALSLFERSIFAKGQCPHCNALLVESKGMDVHGQMFVCVGRFFSHAFQVTAVGAETAVAYLGSSTPADRT